MRPTDPFDASIPVLTEILQHGAVPQPQPTPTPVFFYRAPSSGIGHSGVRHDAQDRGDAGQIHRSRQVDQVDQVDQDAAAIINTATVDADIDADTDTAADATGSTAVNVLTSIDGSNQAWDALERQLSERIWHRLQEHVDGALEQRINECLAQALRHAVRDLSSQIRLDLHETVANIVAGAVADELTSLKSLQK